MPNYVSPGVYVIEKDVSDFPPTVNSSVVGIVGFASKGPIAGLNDDKATLITSQENLIKTFGKPTESIPGQGIEAAMEILESTNQVYFSRVATSSADEATVNVAIGACPVIWVSSNASGTYLGVSSASPASAFYFAVDVYNSAGVLAYSSPSSDNIIWPVVSSVANPKTNATAMAALAKLFVTNKHLNVTQTPELATFNVAPLVNIHAGSGAYMTVTTWAASSDGSTVSGAAVAVNIIASSVSPSLIVSATNGAVQSSKTVSGIQFSDIRYKVQSLYPGDGYNLSSTLDGEILGNSVEIDDIGVNTILTVNDAGVEAESYSVNLNNTSFVESKVGNSLTTATSEYVFGTLLDVAVDISPDLVNGAGFSSTLVNIMAASGTGFGGTNAVTDVNPRFIKFVEGTYNLASGNSGYAVAGDTMDTAVIGTVRADGGRTGIESFDDDTLNISVALAPGVGFSDSDAIQNALITKAEDTQAFIALISPPFAEVTNVQDAINWHNGVSLTRTTAVNSSYAAIYWPWVKVFSVADGKDIWMAPEIFAARQMAYTDSTSEPWFAPAGYSRGRLTKPTEVEVILNQGDRDALYGAGNAINPIVKFPQQGIVIFGQRTAQRSPTALDRVNIRRMMIVIRKMILAATTRLVFEPNDPITWARVETILNPMLNDIKLRRGITEFKVVCDNTTNTPLRIDRNEMWTKVIIKPTKTAEVLVFEINLTNQSADLGSV